MFFCFFLFLRGWTLFFSVFFFLRMTNTSNEKIREIFIYHCAAWILQVHCTDQAMTGPLLQQYHFASWILQQKGIDHIKGKIWSFQNILATWTFWILQVHKWFSHRLERQRNSLYNASLPWILANYIYINIFNEKDTCIHQIKPCHQP